MPFDVLPEELRPRESQKPQVRTPAHARSRRGSVSYHKGLSAEDQVARHYERRGVTLLKRRWRGAAGEIDLIFRDGHCIVFAEVKCSRDHATAAANLSARQINRLFMAAAEFAGTLSTGSLTEMRFDVALVDNTGAIAVLENALMAA